jgi:hypothetical protein
MSHVDAQTIGDGFYCTLGGTVHISARIGSIASHTSDVDDMTTIAFHHAGNDESGHGEQTFNVGIYHLVPVVEVAFVLWFQASCQSCIIDNNKNIVQKGYDYVIIVKKGIVDLTYQDMEKELLKLLSMGD